MPPRTPKDLHVDKMLTQISIAYAQSRTDFISERLFPSIGVDYQSDLYRVYPKEWWLRTFAEKRAPATESRGVTWVYSEDSYRCEKFSIHTDVPEEELANEDDDLDVARDAAELVMEQIMLKRERDFIDTYLATGVWGADVDVNTDSTAWSASSTATPLQDISDQALTMKSKTGLMPNVIAMAWPTFNRLRYTDQILDRIIYGGGPDNPADVTPSHLAALFGVEEVMMAGVIENTSPMGAESDADTDFMLSDGLLLAYRAPRPSPRRPSAGYTFKWRRAAGSANGLRTKRFEMPQLDSERFESDDFRDQKVVASELGVYFHTTAA